MADMDWVRKTHDDYIKGMQKHAAELENNNERHLYGAAINRITLLMEHIDELEVAARKRVLYGHSRMCQREMETHSQPCTCGHTELAALIGEEDNE